MERLQFVESNIKAGSVVNGVINDFILYGF